MTDSYATHLDYFIAQQEFGLDDFQIQGCQAVERGHGVLVCAPTGAGKTIVGEFAVSLALSRGTKCFYTTPIKALSNQKYHDLCHQHGEDNVGLLTGDVSINHDADVVVMTTEVLRNMIYAESGALDRLSHVVMDEVHFLADKSRGAVWEEAILGLDDSVSVIGLSATVSNAEEFGQWLQSVRGDTEVIVTDHRPVPLDQWMLVGKQLHPLFEPGDITVNRTLEAHIERLEQGRYGGSDWSMHKAKPFRREAGRLPARATHHDKRQILGRPEVISLLKEHEMLPAITFIFSRSGCDGAMYQCMRSRLVLTSQAEAEEIGRIVDRGVEGIPPEDLKVLDFARWKAGLQRGFAAHHAGMLPAFRHIVEELFTKGLVRAVFATETLALGINMPARTVVLEKLVKYNGEAHVDLTPGQYTQLTGRAGRRGIDTMGNAVVLWQPAVDPSAVAGLASTRTYPLISTFAPGYNMAVNLVGTIGFEPAHRLLDQSFAQYQADASIVGEVRAVAKAEKDAEVIRGQLQRLLEASNPASEDPLADIESYVALRRELSDEERRSKRLSIEQREKEVVSVLARLRLGDVVALPGKKRPILAVVIQQAGNNHDPRPWFTFETGWSGRLGADQVGMPPQQVGTMRIPRAAIAHPRKNSGLVVQQFDRADYPRPKKMRHQPRHRTNATIAQLRSDIRTHPVHSWADREDLVRVGEQLLHAQRKVDGLKATISAATDTLGKTFDRILRLLGEYDYVEYEGEIPQVTDEGQRLAKIHSECDLLVAQCLKRGIWDNLDPAELAGVVSMCTFENRRETKGSPEGATDAMVDAMNATVRLWEELSFDERRYRLPVTKYPEAGFALSIHQWAAGAPLGYCLAAAAESGAELTPGDFVRQARQVIDLLEQVRSTAYQDDTRDRARQAIEAIRRGVVAIGS